MAITYANLSVYNKVIDELIIINGKQVRVYIILPFKVIRGGLVK